MQKVLLSLGLLAGVSFAAQAQSISYGVKAGASLTNFTGKGVGSDVKNLFGFNGGLVANFAVNDAFSIQPEVLYSMKGAKTNYTISGVSIDDKIRLHYIDVPVLARVNAGGLFFELGPQVGFLLSANETLEGNGQSQSQDVKSSLKTVDFGYAGGIGYQLANGPGIGLRYNGGFSDIDKNSNSSSNSAATRNSAFQLYLTYMFGSK